MGLQAACVCVCGPHTLFKMYPNPYTHAIVMPSALFVWL